MKAILSALIFALAAARAADAPKTLEAIVDKAMTAYNAADAKAFFSDYAKAMSALANQATFDALYGNAALKEHGKYVSKKLIPAQTVATGETPLLVYEAKFEKTPRIKLSINFMTEDGKPRLMQVTIAKFE